jgi:hypothetical protein
VNCTPDEKKKKKKKKTPNNTDDPMQYPPSPALRFFQLLTSESESEQQGAQITKELSALLKNRDSPNSSFREFVPRQSRNSGSEKHANHWQIAVFSAMNFPLSRVEKKEEWKQFR